jgi:hypothetical protein
MAKTKESKDPLSITISRRTNNVFTRAASVRRLLIGNPLHLEESCVTNVLNLTGGYGSLRVELSESKRLLKRDAEITPQTPTSKCSDVPIQCS